MRVPRELRDAAPFILRRNGAATRTELSTQWKTPSGVLGVLMIVGGDIVQKAIAQVSGGIYAPVSFSFGWVAYGVTTLVALIGDGRLMPAPDYGCSVINIENGYSRSNKSWILGRLLRDNEEQLGDEALSITIYRTKDPARTGLTAGTPTLDKAWLIGIFIILLQLGIAAIPFGLYGDWDIFLVTGSGIILSLLTGALPQWRVEKFACRTDSNKTFALTQGNGSRHIMVIQGGGVGLDLEDMAAGESPRKGRPWEKHGWFTRPALNEKGEVIRIHGKGAGSEDIGQVKWVARLWKGLPLDFHATRLICLTLAVFWIALLISVQALKQNLWFLFLVGGIGTVQNSIIASISRSPSARGIHLERVEHITGMKVMDVLMDAEVSYPGVGKAMLGEFFPGGLKEKFGEPQWWNGDRDIYDQKRSQDPSRGSPRSMQKS